VQVRNKGTIGGSIAHSDPAADWPAAVLALNADLVLVGPGGERTVKAADFIVDLLTTDLRPGEILREIRIEKPSGRFGQAYQKVPHPASGFAVVGIAVHLALNDDGSCKAAQIGVTGVGVKAYRAQGVEAALAGSNLDEQTIAAAAAHACDGVDPNADLYASGEYRCHLAQVHMRRAIQAAKAAVK
jgi:carbon-monoxide dehydrogenase medium subunit